VSFAVEISEISLRLEITPLGYKKSNRMEQRTQIIYLSETSFKPPISVFKKGKAIPATGRGGP
jgi:hypothetical protein